LDYTELKQAVIPETLDHTGLWKKMA